MSMSTHVVGFAPPDEKWQKMKAIWDACEAAKIEAPMEVQKFFDYKDPDPRGVVMNIPYQCWGNDHVQGIEIEVERIPKHVKAIRFYNS